MKHHHEIHCHCHDCAAAHRETAHPDASGRHTPTEEDAADSGGDDHDHAHDHDHGEMLPLLPALGLLAASLLCFFAALLCASPIPRILFYSASVLLAGYDVFLVGIHQLLHLELEENVLLLIAVAAAFALREYSEACIVTMLFKLGIYIEEIAVGRSRKSVEALTAIRPDLALLRDASGGFYSVPAESLQPGDLFYLRAGDRAALDAVVLDGTSSLDTGALTGESLPVSVSPGDAILSGSVNLTGLLCCKVTQSFAHSTASQIIELVYESNQKKGRAEAFITRFARIYTPAVILLAALVAFLPPLFGFGRFADSLSRALIFLVASCPCALVISVPLAFFCAIGASSRLGVLIKGSRYVEQLAGLRAICFDKTGTLTSGNLTVESVIPLDALSENELLTLAAGMESGSTHPIAAAILASCEERASFDSVTESPGRGITAQKEGQIYRCGNKSLLEDAGIPTDSLPDAALYLSRDAAVLGAIRLGEELSPESKSLLSSLRSLGISRAVMLTGDAPTHAAAVADALGIREVHASLLPAEKVAHVEAIRAESGCTAFVGDGINDAPVLAAADLGISMGLGSEIANVSSDVILAGNRLDILPRAIRLARRSLSVIRFNILFALLIKAAVLLLGVFGLAQMWMAVFADIGVTVLCVLNTVRILHFKR